MKKFTKEVIENSGPSILPNDNLVQFWKMIQILIRSNILYLGGDYKIACKERITYLFYRNGDWINAVHIFDKPRDLIYLNTSRLYRLYRHQCLAQGETPMWISKLEYYISKSPALVCESSKVSFRKIDPQTGEQETNEHGVKKRTSTTALIFYLNSTNLQVGTTNEDL